MGKSLALGSVFCFTAVLCFAQSTSVNSGTIQGSVLDPSGAAVVGASVEISNPVSHYDRNAVTDGQGKFELDNVPFNNYHVSVTAPGFQTNMQDVSVRTAVPFELKASLQLGTSSTTVNVEAAGDLIETVPATHTDVDRALDRKSTRLNSSHLG